MCKYATYKLKLANGTWSKDSYHIDLLLKRYDISTIKRFLIKQRLIIIPCGKCSNCIDLKKSCYRRKVESQLNLTKHSYLITITLTNDQQHSLLSYQERDYILYDTNFNYSQFTCLSKIAIDNIIKNWKNKLNRYYGDKVSFNYFLCGEYGSNTKRAHYHILLMLDKPIPDLVNLHIKGDHYRSKLLSSKKFGIYDIQLTNGSLNCAAYITKYLNKPITNGLLSNYNRFEEKQIRYMLDHNIDVFNRFLWPNKETMAMDLMFYWMSQLSSFHDDYMFLFHNYYLWRNKRRYKDITNQREFLKMSRKLGITNDMFYNFNHRVINSYYRSKYKFMWSQVYYLLCSHIIIYNKVCYIWYDLDKCILHMFYLLLSYQLLFKMLDLQRINNIKKYSHLNIVKPDKDQLKYSSWRLNDIF